MAATELKQGDAYLIVGQWWPYDGPYSSEHTGEAAAAIAQLMRYLCNATGKQDALPDPNTSTTVLYELGSAAHRMDQLLRQLQGRLELVDTTRAYDDRRDRPAEQTIADVANEVFAALGLARLLSERILKAAEHASHLGLDDSPTR